MKKKSFYLILAIFVMSSLFRLAHSYWFPMTQDESYYSLWSRFMDFGYFDHPPMVAWLGGLGNMFEASPLAARWGGYIISLCMFPIYISLCSLYNIQTKKTVLICLLLFQFNLAHILNFMQTPDLPLAFFWLLAIHEASVALKVDPRRWVTAGLVTGLGLTSKYTMLLIGLVFLWALIRNHPKLRNPWPYIGGFCCLIAFLPHLAWNLNHDWVTFRFQLGRGFQGNYEVSGMPKPDLPLAKKASTHSAEYEKGQIFAEPEKEKKPKRKKTKLEKFLERSFGFLGGQLVFWGFFIFPLIKALWKKYKSKADKDEELQKIDSSLLKASAVVPLIVFGVLSLFQKVEANWAAVYIISVPLLVGHLPLSLKTILVSAFLNAGLVSLLVWHANQPLGLSKKPSRDRVLKETHGYPALAQHLSNLDGPIFSDTYQNIAQLSFHEPHLKISQWPGIARISEFSRSEKLRHYSLEDIKNHGSFKLLTNNLIPPVIPGFRIDSYTHLRDCLHETIQVFDSKDNFNAMKCEKPIHKWYLAHYISDSSDSSWETSM